MFGYCAFDPLTFLFPKTFILFSFQIFLTLNIHNESNSRQLSWLLSQISTVLVYKLKNNFIKEYRWHSASDLLYSYILRHNCHQGLYTHTYLIINQTEDNNTNISNTLFPIIVRSKIIVRSR